MRTSPRIQSPANLSFSVSLGPKQGSKLFAAQTLPGSDAPFGDALPKEAFLLRISLYVTLRSNSASPALLYAAGRPVLGALRGRKAGQSATLGDRTAGQHFI